MVDVLPAALEGYIKDKDKGISMCLPVKRTFLQLLSYLCGARCCFASSDRCSRLRNGENTHMKAIERLTIPRKLTVLLVVVVILPLLGVVTLAACNILHCFVSFALDAISSSVVSDPSAKF